MPRKIRSITQLRDLAAHEGGIEVFALIAEGIRIVKRLWYFPPTYTQSQEQWDVYHEQDRQFDEALDFETLKNDTLIVDAVRQGALYQYN